MSPLDLRRERQRRARVSAFDRELDRCERVLAQHLAAAVQRFGAAALDVIDLPPLGVSPLVAEQIRAAGVMLWTSHVEAAGLPGFVDAIATGSARGTLLLPLTRGADRLMLYYQKNRDRFDASERVAMYERLFAPPFGDLIDALAAALIEVHRADTQGTARHFAARAGVIARDLGALLTTRAVGVAAFAAREIVAHIREALAILRDPEIAHALGGGTPFQIIRVYGPSLANMSADPSPALDRASAGFAIVSWIAEHAPTLTDAPPIDDPALLEAAERWAIARGARAP